MIAVEKMSGPTSITMTNSVLRDTSIQSLYKNSLGDLDSINEIGSNNKETSSKTKIMATDHIGTERLIETKFNELAAKILGELKQAQYSKEFFKAIDEIIKEPPSKTLHQDLISRRRPTKTTSITTDRQPLPNKYYGNYKNTKMYDQLQTKRFDNIHDQQPRSLPLDVSQLIQRQELKKQQKLQQYKTLQSQLLKAQQQQQQQQQVPQKSSIPKMNGISPRKSTQSTVAVTQEASNTQQRIAYPISKSASSSDRVRLNAPCNQVKVPDQLPSLRRSATISAQTIKSKSTEPEVGPQSLYSARPLTGEQMMMARANNIINVSPNRLIGAQNFYYEDEDDDEDDDEDFDDVDEVSLSFDQTQPRREDQRFNPIIKSKTIGDTIQRNGEIQTGKNGLPLMSSKLMAQQSPPQPDTVQNTGSKQPQSIRRLNSIVRSNTVANGAARKSFDYQANRTTVADQAGRVTDLKDGCGQSRSMVLSSHDVSHLYKPHMNYSTSLLGNHRLSDDDEIIIIPTQSPSLISSTSPDGDAHADELAERFSISRTKSFWERLSKGSGKQNKTSETSPMDNNKVADSTAGAEYGSTRQGQESHQRHQFNATKQTLNQQDVKTIGGRMTNGHSHTLDRMDSTGGSNSNYSCSSSGDENNGIQSRPTTVNQMQLQRELSRQNRFRQTR